MQKLSVPGAKWRNEDLEPTPPERRTWQWWNYAIFYWGLSFGNWTLGSTMIGIGLNWWQSILTIFISQLVSSIAMLFNSRCASVYHVGYPIVGRSVFGMYGSYYFVGVRALLAVIWYGVQLYTGSALLANMLRAVFGHHYTGIPNHIPASIGITSAGMLAFFLFWLIHLPLTFFRPHRLRRFFWFKAIVMLPAILGLFIFCMATTDGRIGLRSLKNTSKAQNNGWGWFFIYSINAGMGNTATLITNQPDIARWSKTKMAPMWSQLLSNPIAVTFSASLGIISTAATNNVWGTTLWNQWELLDAILDRHWTAGGRTGVFFAAAGWSVSILGTNVAANMIPFGADSSVLFPRFIDIPRGQLLVELLGFAICPWKILASASTFTTFLGGYGLFMASVTAIMVCDYWCLTRGNIFLEHLYTAKPNPHYRYLGGVNIQAIIAYIVGIAMPFPGFVGTLGPKVSSAAQKLGQLGWMLSFVSSFVVYYILCRIWPTKNQKIIKQSGYSWEEMSKRELPMGAALDNNWKDYDSQVRIMQKCS
ncbi:putative allantoin permease [Piedraia hortae CBS 480.64]|uniref:Putative allantoin permease n=1 Tax=Piedraia hortae CBS 480.64 TaxID=1314780 RepID=A0A6A7C7K4_9PEZI|nr:putative allantoin permease [Piedraia hortae CBS 480.64]